MSSIDDTTVETLAEELRLSLKEFAAKFGDWHNNHDLTDIDLLIRITGRTDGDIKIVFSTDVYNNGRSVSITGYNDLNALMAELVRRYHVDKAYTVPLITHRS